MSRVFIFKFLLFFIFPFCSFANGNAYLGFSLGPSLGFNRDFNGENLTQTFHFNLGFSALYELKCVSPFCKNAYAEFYFDYVFPSQYQFGSTQINQTGVTGLFSEKVEYFSGLLGFRKNFSSKRRVSPFLGFGIGLSFFRLSEVSYIDAQNESIQLSLNKTEGLHPFLHPFFGISYKISYKMFLDFSARLSFLLPDGLGHSVFSFPIGLKLKI